VVLADAIPEPETYALLLAGIALVGFTARRRALFRLYSIGTL
jgi:PEP-CTERM motif-containing protein